ncbi:glycosyltransferase family 32 protein [Calocera viscosa TUFC12733]|uniref:Glycosyltransferase family 32 protein n=1 Tax=Calocera viscosa (strain TUFC12733) TaxID=1330018 RepID=A0A167KDF7_CALVF|nr:glycosyltransferase family 32 protein [Calocera viscosa TUFC12733]
MLTHHHHASPPHGPYWDLLAPHITLSPLTRPQQLLIDTYVLRSFDRAGLMTHDVVLGMEASPDSRRTAVEPRGLCNAVIVARKDASFLKGWLATYESFDLRVWPAHSVAKPWELALLYPRPSSLCHAWESLAMKYLEPLMQSLVLKGDSSFTRMVRAFVGPEDLKVDKRLSEAQRP